MNQKKNKILSSSYKNKKALNFLRAFFAEPWKKELKTAIQSYEELNKFFKINIQKTNFAIFIPKKLAKRIKKSGENSPLWKQFVPSNCETDDNIQSYGTTDPIGDHNYSVDGQLIHRYTNRILFMPNESCAIQCRYCFRKNELYTRDDIFKKDFSKTLKYLNEHPEINEVIFSGGDPLFIETEKLEEYLDEFSKIKNIKFIRFHSRVPIVIPSRINSKLIKLLKKFNKKFITINFVIHICHKDELTNKVKKKILLLKNSGIEILSQTVLLKGVNDTSEVLTELYQELLELNVRPYYLHHPDKVYGGMHFHLPLKKGRQIYSKLRMNLSGWSLPQYIIDIPEGEGKTPAFNPESYEFSGTLINKNGNFIKI